MFSSTSPFAPASPDASRSSSRSDFERGDGSRTQGQSRTRQLLYAVSGARSRPGTPDLIGGAFDKPRSKSHDALSTFPPLEKQISMSSEASTRHLHSESRMEHPGGFRSLFYKSSRILKTHKSSARLRSANDSFDGNDSTRDTYGATSPSHTGYYHSASSSGIELSLKHTISGPSNFQHLTHTDHNQARKLQSRSRRDLASEFSAIKVAQAPEPELKGIEAQPIHAEGTSESFPDSPLGPTSPFSRPKTRPATPSEPTSPSDSTLTTSKSVDSFTRLAFRSGSFSSLLPPISPPPRRSSRKPANLANVSVVRPHTAVAESPVIPDFPALAAQQPRATLSRSPPRSSPIEQASLATEQPLVDIAQAMTTPDDSACVLMSQPLATPTSPLEDVPEEEEDPAKKEAITQRPLIRHTKSFPSTKHFSKSFASLNLANSSDPMLPIEDNKTEEIPSRNSRRILTTARASGDSWEDGVDFCYEHAMEADNGDWELLTRDEDLSIVHQRDLVMPLGNSSVADAHSSVPSLHSDSLRSTGSSSMTVPGIITPSELSPSSHVISVPRDMNGSTMFTLSPSLLIPREYNSRITHEESYHQKLSDNDAKFQPFNFYTALDSDLTRSYSPRSSGSSPLSKSNSHDSLSVTRSTSSATRTTHRNSNSIGSIPELVGSRSQLSNRMADRPSTEGGPPLSRNIEVMRQDFIKAADSVPQEEIEAASPTTTSHPPFSRSIAGLRSRSNSDSASRMLAGPPMPAHCLDNAEAFKGHLRASSVATGMACVARPKNNRTSYSLFPRAPAPQ